MLPVLLLCTASTVQAHGGMVWPPIWQDGLHTPLEERWDDWAGHNPPVKDPKTNITIAAVRVWLTDQAYTGGHGDEFFGVGPLTNTGKSTLKKRDRCSRGCQKSRNPWAAPGRAPNLGGGCGIMGGNPFGCPKGSDTRPPGSECFRDTPSGWIPRATSSFGSSALQIDFPQAANTDWQLGSSQEVGWVSKGGHRGGYTYRLCKLPAEGKTELTEECFAQNVLEWATDYTMMRETGKRNLGKWNKFRQTDLREGTYPEGSAWRPVRRQGLAEQNGGVIRKDKVIVPSDLPEGEYVLGFRWDSASGNQVWVSCANVRLTADYSSADYEALEEAFRG